MMISKIGLEHPDGQAAGYINARSTVQDSANPRSGSLSEVVLGTDERSQVINTTDIPWRWICQLFIRFPNGVTGFGTGWFSGPHTVITAGHVVFSHANGGWAQEIEVVPGMNGAQRPFGSQATTTFRSVLSWIQDMDPEYDYGAIVMPDDELGKRVGWFGFTALSDSELARSSVNISGYPADKPFGTQWFMTRALTAIEPRRLHYVIDTFGGQSGSPVWRVRDGQYRVVGIHTYGEFDNAATRIVPQVYENMVAWKGQ